VKVLYLSSYLPKRSETFVYNEVLGLIERGFEIPVASLYPPEKELGDQRLDLLAQSSTVVYEGGLASLIAKALAYAVTHPVPAIETMMLACRDAVSATDISFSGRLKVFVQALAALSLAARAPDVDQIHVHMAHAAATIGMYFAKVRGIPFSFTGHAADLFRERCLLREKLQRAQFVSCISLWHREWYQGIVPRPDSDYPVIRCGVDIPAAAPEHHSEPTCHIVGLGRLVPKKGFDLLLEAVRRLTEGGADLKVTIAGDGPEMETLKKLAEGLSVDFPGAVDHRDVPSLLASADVFALPCRVSDDGDRDGIPVVLMEAMAAAVCPISGDLPTIRELITSDCGRLVDPGNVEALTAALAELTADPELRKKLGNQARIRVIEEFSSSTNLDRIELQFTR